VILVATWDADEVGRAGLELLGAALALGGAWGEEVAYASLTGEGAAAAAGGYGAARGFAFAGDLAASGSEGAVAGLAELARGLDARVVLLPADELGSETAPRLAERLAGTAVSHAVALDVADGSVTWTRPVFGGKALATVTAVAEPVVATLRRGAFEPAAPRGGPLEVETLPVPDLDGAVELVTSEAPASGSALEDAPVIVSGGAGVGDPEGFAQLAELAELLGGAVGASLAAVDNGWAPPERQVGLTGKSVSPNVYFAFGISGASQHLAGIGGAKAVVAVNTDPDAPIYRVARFGVVMDCREFLSALIDELRR
jgi:electron transfer flavoprotein alpha subunit